MIVKKLNTPVAFFTMIGVITGESLTYITIKFIYFIFIKLFIQLFMPIVLNLNLVSRIDRGCQVPCHKNDHQNDKSYAHKAYCQDEISGQSYIH